MQSFHLFEWRVVLYAPITGVKGVRCLEKSIIAPSGVCLQGALFSGGKPIHLIFFFFFLLHFVNLIFWASPDREGHHVSLLLERWIWPLAYHQFTTIISRSGIRGRGHKSHSSHPRRTEPASEQHKWKKRTYSRTDGKLKATPIYHCLEAP